MELALRRRFYAEELEAFLEFFNGSALTSPWNSLIASIARSNRCRSRRFLSRRRRRPARE